MKFIRSASVVAFALGILLSSFAVAGAEPTKGREKPTVDLATTQGRMRFSFALLRRHPGMLQENRSYERGLMDAMKPVPQIQAQLGPQAEPLWLNQVTRAHTSYFSGAVTYDEKAREAVTDQLTQDLEKLGLEKPQDLNADLVTLRDRSVQKIEARNGKAARESFDEKQFRKSVMRLLRLAPFLYDGNGKALVTRPTSSELAKLTPSQLDNAYNDTWKLHLKDLMNKSDQIANAVVTAFERDFVDREVARATLARSVNGSVVARAISIEEVPAAVGIYRGCLGGDCSILSVPYYPLVEGSSVFIIRKSNDFDAKPDGYAFVFKVRIGKEVIPYVVTINGTTLTESDAAAVLSLVARVHGQSDVLVPNFGVVRGVVNTEPMKKGMTARESQAVDVPFPEKWSVPAQHRDTRYTDYYSAGAIRSALRAKSTSFPVKNIQTIEVLKVANPYVLPEDLNSIAKLDRALLAIEIFADKEADQNEILNTLRIIQADVEAAKPLTLRRPLDAKTYQKLEETFGYTPRQLLTLDPVNRLETLFNLKKTEKFKRDSTIDQLIASSFKQMESEIKIAAENSSRMDNILNSYFDLKQKAPADSKSVPMETMKTVVESYAKNVMHLATFMKRHKFLEKHSGYPLAEWFTNEINAAQGPRLVNVSHYLVGLEHNDSIRVQFLPFLENRFLAIAATSEGLEPLTLTMTATKLRERNEAFFKKFVEARLSGFEAASANKIKDDSRFVLAVVEATPKSDSRLAHYLAATLSSHANHAFSSSEFVEMLLKLKKSRVPAISQSASGTLNASIEAFKNDPYAMVNSNPKSLAQAFVLAPDLLSDKSFLDKVSRLFNDRSFEATEKIAEASTEAKIFIPHVFLITFKEALKEAGQRIKALALLEAMRDISPKAYVLLFDLMEDRGWGTYRESEAELARKTVVEGFKKNPSVALAVLKSARSRNQQTFALKLMLRSGVRFPAETIDAVKALATKLYGTGKQIYFEERETLTAASLLLFSQTGDREMAKIAFADSYYIRNDAIKAVQDIADTLPEHERQQLVEDLGIYRPEVLLRIEEQFRNHDTRDFMENLLVRYYSTHRSEIPELLNALNEAINRDPGSGVLRTNLEVLARIQPMPELVKNFLEFKLKTRQPQYTYVELNKQAARALLLAGETTPDVLQVLRIWGFPKWYDPQNPTAHIPKPYAPKMSHTRNRCEAAFAQAQ